MRPDNLRTKIFLDGGDPAETREIIDLLGFLDGQTTNPTLISRNPYAKERFAHGEKFTQREIYNFYKQVVQEISPLVSESVSIEVYADQNTTVTDMIEQAREMWMWIPNAHIKLPITAAGLEAAQICIRESMRVNMTLCFTQEQSAAVYAATQGAKEGNVYLSPFVGRLDDRGDNGMSLIENTLQMFRTGGDKHVEVLTASVRSLEHFMAALYYGSDIITAPAKILKIWKETGMKIPTADFTYDAASLKKIPYQEIDLAMPWSTFDIYDELTDKGIARFAQDWNTLIA